MRRRVPILVLIGAAVLVAGGTFGTVRSTADRGAASEVGTRDVAAPPVAGADASAVVASLEARTEAVPTDHVSWASLGLAYVQQARVAVDPTFYDLAERALRESLELAPHDNFLADAGLSSLAAARHQFGDARRFARRGLEINPDSALLYGALADAEMQLGSYDDAIQATQDMVDRQPATASLARVSYTWEVRGNTELARSYMERALADATTPADRAFAWYYLGEISLDQGDAAGALTSYARGLEADPGYTPLLEGRARARAATGDVDGAVADLTTVVGRVPQPSYVLELGELLQSLGRAEAAEEQYALFRAEEALLQKGGVALDVDAARFEADHGDAGRALDIATRGVAARPFFEMQDAYAWALHANGRDTEALEASKRARSLGTRSALLAYHAGMIERSLGDTAAARIDLELAFSINPYFSPLHAPAARTALAELGGE